jgi:regulator of nonsense transcripts 2
LSAYYDTLAVKLVDALLEDIQLGLEVYQCLLYVKLLYLVQKNDFTMHQRRVMQVKLLGELYNYCIFESGVIFDCLYLIVSLGHPNGVATPAPVVDDEEYFVLPPKPLLSINLTSPEGTARMQMDPIHG